MFVLTQFSSRQSNGAVVKNKFAKIYNFFQPPARCGNSTVITYLCVSQSQFLAQKIFNNWFELLSLCLNAASTQLITMMKALWPKAKQSS